MRKYFELFILSFFMLSLMACGGGGGGGGTTSSTGIITGNIEGITYSSASYSGSTTSSGEFQYKAGETVTFSIGGLVLATIEPSSDLITVASLVGDSPELPSIKTLNLQSLLLTLDSDGNPDNGLTIDTTGYQLEGLDLSDSTAIAAVLGQVVDSASADSYFQAAYEEAVLATTKIGSYTAYSNYFHTNTASGSCKRYSGASIELLSTAEGKRIKGTLNLTSGGVELIDELYTSIDGTTESGRNYGFATAYYGGNVGSISIYDGSRDNCLTTMRFTRDGNAPLAPLIAAVENQFGNFYEPIGCSVANPLPRLFYVYLSMQDPDGFLQTAKVDFYINGTISETANLLGSIPYTNKTTMFNKTSVSLNNGDGLFSSTNHVTMTYVQPWSDAIQQKPHLYTTTGFPYGCYDEVKYVVTVTDSDGITSTYSSEVTPAAATGNTSGYSVCIENYVKTNACDLMTDLGAGITVSSYPVGSCNSLVPNGVHLTLTESQSGAYQADNYVLDAQITATQAAAMNDSLVSCLITGLPDTL